MRLLHVVGARPNFMKAAPVWQAIAELPNFEQILVHTEQHYDVNMSGVFFTELRLPAPHYSLGVGSGSHARQTAAVMVAFEKVVLQTHPDWVIVYGDVNSTVAAALVCAKLLVPVAHVEAGLRSFDRTMPEEINRIITDQIARMLFTPSADGDANLSQEGIPKDQIYRVGNVMIDSLIHLLPFAQQRPVLADLKVEPKQYAVLTMHRPSNVDSDTTLRTWLDTVAGLSARLPVIFPVHPRTRQRIDNLNLGCNLGHLRFIEPLSYLDFLRLMSQARIVLTDSGGIQEETTYLGIPCLTLRENTERPVTVEMGTNTLIGQDADQLRLQFNRILDGDRSWDHRPPGGIPLWDGHAAKRIAQVLLEERVGLGD